MGAKDEKQEMKMPIELKVAIFIMLINIASALFLVLYHLAG